MEERAVDTYGQWQALLMEAKEAGLTPEEVRQFIRGENREEERFLRPLI